MATDRAPDPAPLPRAFRRRFPLELTVEECELLEQARERCGTKRAALVAGLAALAELEQLEGAQEQLSVEYANALARIAELEEALTAAEAGLRAAKGEVTKDAKQQAKAERERAQASTKVSQRLRELERALREERTQAEALTEELEELTAERLDAVRCGRCGQWAEPEEWGTRRTKDGEQLVYHRPCGFERGGFLDPRSSILGLRRVM